MTSPQWSPAPKRGLIPLRPLDFGTILGKSFASLRHNPAVLLGFGVCTQLVVSLLALGLFVLIFATGFDRIDTLSPSDPDYDAIMAGTLGLSLGGGLVLSLLSVAVGAAVQGVVAANLRIAALGEKPRLSEVWRQVKPVFWRLIGYTLLVGVAAFAAITVLAFIAVGAGLGIGAAAGDAGVGAGIAITLGLLLLLGFFVLAIWIGTKLLLVPTVLVIERCKIGKAVGRSWFLVRGRFWAAFGATALVGLIVGFAANAVSGVAQLFSMLLIPLLMPTGDPYEGSELSPTAVIVMVLVFALPQLLTLVISAVGTIAQNTAASLIYLDSRMRKEGLDQSLASYVEHRAVGWAPEQLGDPYALPQFAAQSGPYAQQQPGYYAQQPPTYYAQQPPTAQQSTAQPGYYEQPGPM